MRYLLWLIIKGLILAIPNSTKYTQQYQKQGLIAFSLIAFRKLLNIQIVEMQKKNLNSKEHIWTLLLNPVSSQALRKCMRDFTPYTKFSILVKVFFILLFSTGCGTSLSSQRAETGLPEDLASGQMAIPMAMDPTEVAVTRLQDADTLHTISRHEYTIGADDELEVSIFARKFSVDTDLEEVTVRDDGRIYLSLLGEMAAAGLKVSELREEIARRAQVFVKDPFVQVTVTAHNSQRATIFGELGGGGGGGGGGGRAIQVPLQGPTRLVDLLTADVMTNGQAVENTISSPSPVADLSNIIVTRRTGERYRVNLNAYLFGVDHDANLEIVDGDLIFVPSLENNRVFVLGEVVAQGVVPIGLGLTAAEAVARSGGFTNIARRNSVKLVRGGLGNPELIDVPVWNVAKRGHREEDVYLRNGDILFIPRSPIGGLNILLTQILPPLQSYLLIQALFN